MFLKCISNVSKIFGMFLILSRATKQQQLAKGEYFVDNSEKKFGVFNQSYLF